MLDKAIELNGVGNARQLGGYRAGGRRVKDGVLLRTAGLDRMSPETMGALQNRFRVQMVVDLRMSMERAALPDPEIPGAENLHLPVMEAEDMLKDVDPKLAAMYGDPGISRMEMFEAIYAQNIINDQMYIGFLLTEQGKAAYRAFFRALLRLEEGRAMLWHCTDGKDRTGCAAMLVLFALGADRETVMRDYLLTNAFNARLLEDVRRKAAPLGFPEDKLNALLVMSGGVDASFMENAIDALEREYGSVRGYLNEALGVGNGEIEALREKLLTD